MASCVECNVKMGYSETNASRNHDGLCIACYVKSLVKTKINAANITKKPTNARSLDHLFEKFESITLTSETSPNIRVRKILLILFIIFNFVNVFANVLIFSFFISTIFLFSLLQ